MRISRHGLVEKKAAMQNSRHVVAFSTFEPLGVQAARIVETLSRKSPEAKRWDASSLGVVGAREELALRAPREAREALLRNVRETIRAQTTEANPGSMSAASLRRHWREAD
jgi:hypothetical protein